MRVCRGLWSCLVQSLQALDFAWDLGSKTLNARPLDPNFMDRICVSRPEAKSLQSPRGHSTPE